MNSRRVTESSRRDCNGLVVTYHEYTKASKTHSGNLVLTTKRHLDLDREHSCLGCERCGYESRPQALSRLKAEIDEMGEAFFQTNSCEGMHDGQKYAIWFSTGFSGAYWEPPKPGETVITEFE